jgi:hypothetical protein
LFYFSSFFFFSEKKKEKKKKTVVVDYHYTALFICSKITIRRGAPLLLLPAPVDDRLFVCFFFSFYYINTGTIV